MRILVTGCKGFVGSVLCQRGMELGHEMIGLDDESRGLNDLSFMGDSYIKHDCLGGITEPFRARYGAKAKVDAVVHFAALTGELQRPMPELMLYNESMMLRAYSDALDLGARAFVFPTTSLALGVPDSGYVISKESALKTLLSVDKAKLAIPLRFFNVAGAYKGLTENRKNEVHICYKIVEAWRSRQPFVINGEDYDTRDGTPSRDFVNVVNVVDYVFHLLRQKVFKGSTHEQPHEDGAIWLGTGTLTTALQAATIFRNAFGDVALKIQRAGRRSFDCGSLLVDEKQRQQFENAAKSFVSNPFIVTPRITLRDEFFELTGIKD